MVSFQEENVQWGGEKYEMFLKKYKTKHHPHGRCHRNSASWAIRDSNPGQID